MKKPIEELENDEEIEIVEEIEESNDDDIFDKARTIMEYEDFAVLENIFWDLVPDSRETIVSILEERFKKEPQSKDVLEWFLEKVKYV